jgi:hypothetical protein
MGGEKQVRVWIAFELLRHEEAVRGEGEGFVVGTPLDAEPIESESYTTSSMHDLMMGIII